VLDDKNAGSIAEICRRLDGIPLAIELAAARVKVLAVDQIRAKLDDRFRLLTGGSKAGLPRHQTLLATIQWSYDQLHADEQRLLRALAAFTGGWTLEGATAVCGISDDEFEVLDLLTRLVDKSLVVVETPRGGASRYRYLETVRAYANERLIQAQERAAVRDRHSTFYCEIAERSEPELRGPNQAEWVRQLNLENENLLSAISWREPPDGKPELALRIAGATWRYWVISGYLGLGRSLLQQLVPVAASAPPDVRARVLYGLAVLAFTQADYDAARKGIEECLVLYREAGDLEREAACLGMLGNIAGEQKDIPAARERYAEALEICRKAGNQRGVATHLNNLGVLAWRQQDSEARTMFDEAANVMRELGDRNSLAIVLSNLANIATGQGDLPGARAYLVEGFKIIQELGSKRPSLMVVEVASDLANALGEPLRAVTLRGTADAMREAFHIPFGPTAKQIVEETMAGLREKVGAEFERAWEAGRVQDLDEALAATLAWLEGDGRATE
jgi:non-specific serine/threonine protein kinase